MSHLSRRQFVKTTVATSAVGLSASIASNETQAAIVSSGPKAFRSQWHKLPDRIWTGPDTWANPWEDWCIDDGRLTCISSAKGKRTVHCLTHQLGEKQGSAEISVLVSCRNLDSLPLQKSKNARPPTLAGFEIGIRIKDPIDDYRSRLLFGYGILLGVTPSGELRVARKTGPVIAPLADALREGKAVRLVCKIQPQGGKDTCKLTLTASPPVGDAPFGSLTLNNIPAKKLVGNIALASCLSRGIEREDAKAVPGGLFTFADWTIDGDKVTSAPRQSFGPVLWTLYTLSRGVMKLTAQMPPLGKADEQTARLQIKSDGSWNTIATAKIDELAKTATFRLPDWNDRHDVPYRVCWTQKFTDGTKKQYTYSGTVRRDPKDKPEITVAGYCCFMDYLFPNADIAAQTAKHNPDIMLFMGDQIYESVGGYGILRDGDMSRMMANYLRKLALLGWSFRELTKDRPTVWMPDDHDVYHGNVWGAAGRKISLDEWKSKSGYDGSRCDGSKGGYVQPAEFVKAVERTQTAHLPDPYDPTPVGQGIGVYYCGLNYGRVSFAILEDRKFKSGPMSVFKHKSHRPDWIVDRQAALDADVPEAVLLGERQLKFLADWAEDWRGADMKIVVSQTIFCNAATHHGAPGHFLVADMDSNGWPQSGRKRALDIIRRSSALMLAGDQHLPTVIQHGIAKHHDAGFSFCVPAGATGYQRWWRPEEIDEMTREGGRHGDAPNTGKYRDGFGNLIDVHALANPPIKRKWKSRLYMGRQKSAGFGLVRVDKAKGTFTLEAWPVGAEGNDQYAGWPLAVAAADCSGAVNPQLPPVVLANWDQSELPVVRVTDADGRLVTISRMSGKTFAPRVFDADGKYTVQILAPGTNASADRVLKTFKDVSVGQSSGLRL
ncbi:MAG: alkaline phosphatase D family protein [Planctomycetota bacterium]|nr:alkaline phosphatase D family protein [Planctomycetota bacterium]